MQALFACSDVPALQAVQVEAPAAEIVPLEHFTQKEVPVDAHRVLQLKHLTARRSPVVAEKAPVGQFEHDAAPTLLIVPAGHNKQTDEFH